MRMWMTLVTGAALVLGLPGGIGGLAGELPLAGAQPAPPAAAGTTLEWPRHLDTPQGRVTLFQPQPTNLDGDRLHARAALAVNPAGATNVVFGVAELEAVSSRDPNAPTTTISRLAVTRVHFPAAEAPGMTGLAATLTSDLAPLTWTLSAEALDSGLDASTRERLAARDLNREPPRILYSPAPAVLIVLDGPPQLRPLTNSPIMRVINTPYAMVFDSATKSYWLRGVEAWYTAGEWNGDWTPSPQPPEPVVTALAAKAGEPQTQVSSVSGAPVPRILVSGEPAELIVTRGEPTYTPVPGNELFYVSNSDQLLFLELETKAYYVVFSGRWYRSHSLQGPWEPTASDRLPAAFARIPPGSPKSEVLTYVAGTREAEDAVAQAAIPQITAVEPGPARLEVKYDGEPRFQPVTDAGVQWATNTADAVFLVRGGYYVCRDAVWYTGPGPEGPWTVATSVPVEIQSLPPSHPHYNVKYVYVYGTSPETVYVGYLPAYAGCYVAGPTIVYGTGWWYPGYYAPACFWSYPATFGFGYAYSSWSGWSVGFSCGYGWLGWGYGWGWRGCYPVGWWGPCGAYWACAPRYPCYAGPHRGHGGGSSHGGGSYGGPPPGSRPGGPPGAHMARSDPRKDSPGPYTRPSNPQRRSLPEYGRTVKSPYQAPTRLSSARGTDFKSPGRSGASGIAAPSRANVPGRTDLSGRQRAAAPTGNRSLARSDAARTFPGAPTVSRTVPPSRLPGASTSAGARSFPAARSPVPNSAARQVPSAAPRSAPTRSWGNASPSFRSPAAASRSSAYPGYPAGSRSRGGSMTPPRSSPSRTFGGASPSRGLSPSWSAPPRQGFSSPGFSSRMPSAPTRMSPPPSSGSMGRGGVSRGR